MPNDTTTRWTVLAHDAVARYLRALTIAQLLFKPNAN